MSLPETSPVAVALLTALREGNLGNLQTIVDGNPSITKVRLLDEKNHSRTLLHVLTDWPGDFPNAPKLARFVIERGGDVNARFGGEARETPLHWAASCGDVAMIKELLDCGADIDADGAVIAGETALSDAVAFGQWDAARLLMQRGATTKLWHVAAAGPLDKFHSLINNSATTLTRNELTSALWHACHGGQREIAQLLVERGADLSWKGYKDLTPAEIAEKGGFKDLALWLRGGAKKQ